MNEMNIGSNHRRLSWLRSTLVAGIGLALGVALWTATVPMTMAQGGSAIHQVEANLPRGQSIANASKADLLSAICAAVKKNPKAAPQIARAVAEARPDLGRDIMRTIFRCLGNGDCDLLGHVYRSLTSALPDQASGLTSLAIELSPDCAGTFGGAPVGEDNFGPSAVNQNPPPGTIAGGGGQSAVVAICHNGHTIFLSPQAAQDDLNHNPGDTLGPCVVTPVTNK